MTQRNPSTSQVFSASQSKGVLAELMTFLFGETSKATASMMASESHRQATTRVEPGGVSPAVEDTAAPTVEVDAPLQGTLAGTFKEALTGATASFIRRYVTPIHEEKNTWGFNLRRVVVMYPDAAVFFLKDFTTMAAEIRDEISKIRIQKASGAEQLCLDSYYGISFENTSGDAVFEGRLVEQLVMWRGASVNIRFVFDGEYAVLPKRVAAPTPVSGVVSESAQTPAVCKDQKPLPAKTDMPLAEDGTDVRVTQSAGGRIDQRMPSVDRGDHRSGMSGLTPMRPALLKPRVMDSGTPRRSSIGAPVKLPCLRMHLTAGDEFHQMDIYENDFPITVGRHSSFEGFAVTRATDEQPPIPLFATAFPSACTDVFTSRAHLTLNKAEGGFRNLLVDNSIGATKNGTFLRGKPQRDHFIYDTGSDEWISLGSTLGAVLKVKFSRV